jgi:curved DNA-binding protein CbpA
MNPYDELGVAPDATVDEVRRAYRSKAKVAHPDRGGKAEKFAALVLARDVLSDAERRARFDRDGVIDETRPDDRDAHAMNCVVAAIDHVFEGITARGGNYDQYDIVADAKTFLRQQRAGAEKSKRDALDNAEMLKRLAARFKVKKKGAPNKMRVLFEQRVKDLLRQVEAVERDVEKFSRAVEILEGYTFDCNLQTQPVGFMGAW